MQVDTWTTRQKENVFALSIEGKEEKAYYNQQYHLRSTKTVMERLHHPG
jgi:hypothetical protein